MTYSGAIHPLLIREVAGTLFKYLTKNELLIARLVCSHWKTIAWNELVKRVLICFRTTCALESYIKFFNNSSYILSPFTSYKFFFQFPPNCTTLLVDFFTKFGSRIIHLDLQYSNIFFTKELQNFLTSLKYLSISSSRFELSESIEDFTLKSLHSFEIFVEVSNEYLNLIEEFLKRQNCLKLFKINSTQNSLIFSERLIDMIISSTSLKLPYFEELNINFPIYKQNLYNLAKSKLQLKSISITIQNKNTMITESLYEFLQSQKSSLKKFHCQFCRWWEPEIEYGKIPLLNFLHEIHLEYISGDLQFLSNCQNLKKVKILFWRPNVSHITSKESISIMPFVDSLIMSLSGFPTVYVILNYVTILFPGLKLFEFNANITGDTGIYTQLIRDRLPQLTERSVERLKLF